MVPSRRILPAEGRLKQGMVSQTALRSHYLHYPLKRQVMILLPSQCRFLHPFE